MTPINSPSASILIIDDDEQIRGLLIELLSTEFDCVGADSAESALSVIETRNFDLVISDIQMKGISGLDLVPRIIDRAPETVVVMISGQQTIDFAIESMRAGAFDYITKPLDLRHVQAAVHRALDHHRLLEDKRLYEHQLEKLVKERTARIEHLAFYDALTDLPNRALLTDRFEQALATARHRRGRVGLILLSLDRFKKVNDTLGHEVGDLLLKQVAARLRAVVNESDTLARSGDDEFALLLTRIESTEELTDNWRAVSETINPPFAVAGSEIFVTASSGISLFPNDGSDSTSILKNASAALFRAKKLGGNNYQFYTADMNARAIERLALENSLSKASQNSEFITYYQPVVELATGEIAGMEALVRWQHPELGVLAPGEFIHLAEDTGLIIDIGHQVMSSACAQARRWQEQGFGVLRISVNVSARQFRNEGFLDRVVEILGQTRLDPQNLELELTETSIMENADSAVRVLSALRKMGIKIGIDDFGTGYSSLSYLKRLPIDTLKLDQSFVQGATSDPKDAALVMAIITLAHNLDLKVIAEGVESEDQRTFLRLLRCDGGQGFLFGKPVPADVFESSLTHQPQRKPERLVTSPRKDSNSVRTALNQQICSRGD